MFELTRISASQSIHHHHQKEQIRRAFSEENQTREINFMEFLLLFEFGVWFVVKKIIYIRMARTFSGDGSKCK